MKRLFSNLACAVICALHCDRRPRPDIEARDAAHFAAAAANSCRDLYNKES